jgi:hypothetical protein
MITTNEVFIRTKGVDPVMPMVRWLRYKGLIQGVDFDFRYQQAKTQWLDNIELIQNGVSFYFTEAKWATFMRLKYGDNTQGPESGSDWLSW